MAGQKILLIEDEKMLSKLYGDVLAQKGYHVSVAASIDEALEVLARGLPDLILIDIMLPEIDGIEGCRMIRERHGREAPVLFVSVLDDVDTITRAFAAGGDDYLSKQSSLEDILNRVQLWLDMAPEERADQTRRYREALC
jgi:DNA-binding response OmpR family regulator